MNNEQMSEPTKIKFENILTCGFEEEVEKCQLWPKMTKNIQQK